MNDDNTHTEEEKSNEPQENTELDAAKQKINELTEVAQRAAADLQNIKRRTEEEKQAFAKFATANVFLEILPVYDSLARAAAHLPEELKDNEWAKGIASIEKQFEQIMGRFTITKMKTVGEKFDHNIHEAVSQALGEKDVIIEELEAGYMLDDQPLRPAKVVVGDGSSTE